MKNLNIARKLIIMLSAILALLLSVLCVVGVMNHTYSEQNPSSENKTVIETAKDHDVVVKQDNTQQGLTQNTTTISGKTEDIWFYKKNTTYNVQFQFSNMFPGDSISRDYAIKISHNGPIDARLNVKVREGYEKLAEVMRLQIIENGTVIYDSVMKDTYFVKQITSSSTTTTEVDYKINAYLPTSAGNEYQDLDLVCDFVWTAEEVGYGKLVPVTEAIANSKWFGIGISCIVLGMILIFISRKRGEHDGR